MSVTAHTEDIDTIAAWLVTRTGNGVEQPDSHSVCTTLADADAARTLGHELAAAFAVAIAYQPVAAVDWSTHWRDGIVARHFGRLTLTPSWLAVPPTGDEVVVVIDPESAFGSGEHGSTRGAVALVTRHLRGGDRVLDFGSGSGVLAIAACRLGAQYAIGIEVDADSVPVAEANASRNGVAACARFLVGDAEALGPFLGPAEMICSNILRSVNTRLLPVIHDTLRPGGVAIFAGMEDAEQVLFQPAAERSGFVLFDEVHDAGWWSVAARRS